MIRNQDEFIQNLASVFSEILVIETNTLGLPIQLNTSSI